MKVDCINDKAFSYKTFGHPIINVVFYKFNPNQTICRIRIKLGSKVISETQKSAK